MFTLPKYTGSHDAGFEPFNAENLALIASCQRLLKKAPKLYASNEDFSTIKARALEKKRLRNLLKFPDAQIDAAKQLMAIGLQEKALREQVKWSKKFQDDLSRPDIWARLFLAVPVSEQMELCRIQQHWQHHVTFAAFSNQALITVAHDIAPAVASFLELLKAELKRKSQSLFGKREYLEVKAYAASLNDWLHQIKNALAQAMAGRLMMASDAGDLGVSDVCVTTAMKLKNIGALPPHYQVRAPRYSLTSTQFNAFHDFIGNARSGLAAALQSQLSWLKTDTQYQSIVIDKKLVIVPESILPLMPTSKRGRANATINNKETLVDYLARHRYTIAETRMLNRPIVIHDNEKASEQMKRLSAQMEKIATELNTLTKSKPTTWWARWFQRGKIHRLNALSNHWLHSASQLLDVTLDALRQLVQHWQEEFVQNKTVNFTSLQIALINAIAKISQQADAMGVATAIQKTTFAKLQQRYFTLYAHLKPETPQMQQYLDELARGELKSSARLLPLTNYLEDLRHQTDSTELKNFLDAAKPAVTTLMKTTILLLRRMGEQVEGLTSEECQSLGRSVHWLFQLGSDDERKAIKKSLAELWHTYLSRLSTIPQEPSHAWFTQCENTLSTLYLLFGETSQANVIQSLQQERTAMDTKTIPVPLQQKARGLLTDIETHTWQGRCEKARDRFIETLWSNLDSTFTTHKAACHRALEQLIQKAVKEKKPSIKELTLEPHQQSLLELDNSNSPRLRSSDKLVWVMQLRFEGTIDELKQRHVHIEQQQQIVNSAASRWGFLNKPCRNENPAAETKTTHTAQPIF